jgi:uncharacterized protein (TIGR03067 family)
MDLTITEGNNFRGKTAYAIYSQEGDTLKWCSNDPGKKDRPSEFPAKEGGGTYVYVIFKKVK